ncbi:MAG: hypothetical protein Faunusvirus2_56 [Faunusvirus sp.]|uniref:Bacteriophage T5 Orf172 DNA-binding domain-containing protein n=1 Tax=Faunusvirus sp. TaxID=2487766 RepID=A0A3G5A0L7_9VIRU|nr:MAG: hypothetical protein Faunusvirus2_56 [Faunusvirus sp.]
MAALSMKELIYDDTVLPFPEEWQEDNFGHVAVEVKPVRLPITMNVLPQRILVRAKRYQSRINRFEVGNHDEKKCVKKVSDKEYILRRNVQDVKPKVDKKTELRQSVKQVEKSAKDIKQPPSTVEKKDAPRRSSRTAGQPKPNYVVPNEFVDIDKDSFANPGGKMQLLRQVAKIPEKYRLERMVYLVRIYISNQGRDFYKIGYSDNIHQHIGKDLSTEFGSNHKIEIMVLIKVHHKSVERKIHKSLVRYNIPIEVGLHKKKEIYLIVPEVRDYMMQFEGDKYVA